uniref:Retrotransposon gag domain-containing protein n=1 Tax=Tanacetum cinerariifolium TaxID=118510 RepID=A0A699HR51_TANCI|nr:hypothetical protein [Tanacetum cinerariifolium]
MKYQPLHFRGTEGVVDLSRWVEKMESVFHISGCTIENQVKFMTCTMLDAALTWWNGHVRTLGHDAAYAMTWETFKKKLTDKYCPKGEIKKLKIELWNLKVKENDVGGYTQRFQELTLIPKTLDFSIELANDLMDQKLRTYAERQAENRRKLDRTTRINNNFLRNKIWFKLMRQGLERRNRTDDLNLCALSETITMMESVHPRNYRSDCPVLKNQGTKARGMVYALGGGATNQDLDDIKDDINA